MEEKKRNRKKIELDNNKRFIKCFIDDDIDVTIIEILPEVDIPEDKYLYPDLNYKNGFHIYIDEKIILHQATHILINIKLKSIFWRRN